MRIFRPRRDKATTGMGCASSRAKLHSAFGGKKGRSIDFRKAEH
jgi:hypothetical protein